MLNYQIGSCYSKTYSKIADFFEFELLDFRKADKVYRIGMDTLTSMNSTDDIESDNTFHPHMRKSSHNRKRANITYDKEMGSLKSLYDRFCDRMRRRIDNEALREANELRENPKTQIRKSKEIEKIRKEND
jgi:galactose-1-phosphate uridylyltransferase